MIIIASEPWSSVVNLTKRIDQDYVLLLLVLVLLLIVKLRLILVYKSLVP